VHSKMANLSLEFWARALCWGQEQLRANAANWWLAVQAESFQQSHHAELLPTQEDGWQTDKLLEAAQSALGVLDRATKASPAGGLRAQLAGVKASFEHVCMVAADFRCEAGDDGDLEGRCARALLEIEAVLSQQQIPPLPTTALADLKVLQRHARDVVMAGCGRYLSEQDLMSKGMAPALRDRLVSAFPAGALDDDDLKSRLGNAKWQVFTYGMTSPGRGYPGSRMTRPRTDTTPAKDGTAATSAAASSSGATDDSATGLNVPRSGELPPPPGLGPPDAWAAEG